MQHHDCDVNRHHSNSCLHHAWLRKVKMVLGISVSSSLRTTCTDDIKKLLKGLYMCVKLLVMRWSLYWGDWVTVEFSPIFFFYSSVVRSRCAWSATYFRDYLWFPVRFTSLELKICVSTTMSVTWCTRGTHNCSATVTILVYLCDYMSCVNGLHISSCHVLPCFLSAHWSLAAQNMRLITSVRNDDVATTAVPNLIMHWNRRLRVYAI